MNTRQSRITVRLQAIGSIDGQEGQGLVEYALILLFISIAAIGGLSTFGIGANSLYASIIARLPF